jgi:lysophospholipase L1-like esterase
MNALPSDPDSAETCPEQASGAASSNSAAACYVAAAIVALAAAISPATIHLLIGLDFRLLLLSLSFDLFLLLVAAAVLAHGRLRELVFHLIAWTIPLVLLAGLEIIAGAIHLSDRVAAIEDFSTVKRGNNWGSGINHLAPVKDGFAVYRPWSGNGVTINKVGLRTPPPAPKSPGEHRIAVSGSSNVWGFALADADTIPALLQATLRRNGHENISVYNFGVEDATLAKELALLRRFKDIYGIDQVVFFSGGADVFREYFAIGGQPLEASPMGKRIASFELYRTLDRIRTHWIGPSPDRLARIEQSLAGVPKANRLTDGIMAANDYCRAVALRCDFVLTPLLASRRTPIGTETRLVQWTQNMYPGVEKLTSRMYRDALDLGLAGQVHDFTEVFDRNSEQVYIDGGHNNEAGNLAIVDALLPIVTAALPSK